MTEQKKPYGYWIGKNEIYPVPFCSHADVALEILKEKYGENTYDRILASEYSVYQYMFYLGYVRVVNEGNTHAVEYRKGHKLSRLQKDFANTAYYVTKLGRKNYHDNH